MVILYLFYDLFYGKGASWEKGYIFAVYLLAVERVLHPSNVIVEERETRRKIAQKCKYPLDKRQRWNYNQK